MALEGVHPSTLTVTHICDGEEVVTGGEDGQVWIATFAQSALAHIFVRHTQATHEVVFGERAELETAAAPKSPAVEVEEFMRRVNRDANWPDPV